MKLHLLFQALIFLETKNGRSLKKLVDEYVRFVDLLMRQESYGFSGFLGASLSL